MFVSPRSVPSVVSGVLFGQMFHADTVFLNAVNGVTLHNMTSRAKLSALQTFYTSMYGGRQISFQDPFTNNLLT